MQNKQMKTQNTFANMTHLFNKNTINYTHGKHPSVANKSCNSKLVLDGVTLFPAEKNLTCEASASFIF